MSRADLLKATQEWQKTLPKRDNLIKKAFKIFQSEEYKNSKDQFPMLDKNDYKYIDNLVDELFKNGIRLLACARNRRTPNVEQIKEKLKEGLNLRRSWYQHTSWEFIDIKPDQTMNILRQFGYNDEQIEEFMKTHFIGSNARKGELEFMLERVRENTIRSHRTRR